ncbi:MAG: asparaginase [Chloroflexi bacterium]|nr:asparaginase [Chloroflexota bacterium]
MAAQIPRIAVVATGGSIAGVGPDRMDFILYPELGEHITIQESLARIPEVADIARIEAEDLVSVGSTAIGPAEWLSLTKRINQLVDRADVAGVVVTHGTATLEETAYFLHLTIKSSKAVVVTGAMRPPTAISTDADLNLLDAIRVAAAPVAAGKGVLTILNNEIQCARDVVKTNTFRVETFKPNELGFLGYADSDGEVVLYRAPLRRHTTVTEFSVDDRDSLPRVDIVYCYAGSDELLIDAVRANGSQGLVLAGFGGGSFPPRAIEAAAQAVTDGIPVVLASRSLAGRVVMTPRKEEQNFIVSDNLQPQKARILLMLGLTVTQERQELQRMFAEY